ncbi:MAG: Hsp20/alpha crystallin family protein [Lachnospiraceae bacterium]
MSTPFFDDFFDDFFPYQRTAHRRPEDAPMKTDILETKDEYVIELEVPGFTKDELSVRLDNGSLVVSAAHPEKEESDVEEPETKYLHRERYLGRLGRRFQVGSYLTQNDIKARFENGILTLRFPKEAPKKVEESRYINIE